MKAIEISIVLPIFNEKENITILYDELKKVLGSMSQNYEIIMIDDGSNDGSDDIIKQIANSDSSVTALFFRRNFGQTAAMDAGFKQSKGKIVIPLDADLQNDPADIPRLLAKLDQGYDVVKGWRKNRKDKNLTRKIPSKIANFIIRRSTGVNIHDYGCTLTAFKSEILKDINLYGEMHRFIPVYAAMVGGKITEIKVNHRERKYGKTKYNLSRTFKVIFDLLTVKFFAGYTTKPLYFFGKWGFVSFFVSLLFLFGTTYKKFALNVDVHRNPMFLIAIFFGLAGIQMILMGLLAEVIVRNYYESRGKTFYIIKEILNNNKTKPDKSETNSSSEQ